MATGRWRKTKPRKTGGERGPGVRSRVFSSSLRSGLKAPSRVCWPDSGRRPRGNGRVTGASRDVRCAAAGIIGDVVEVEAVVGIARTTRVASVAGAGVVGVGRIVRVAVVARAGGIVTVGVAVRAAGIVRIGLVVTAADLVRIAGVVWVVGSGRVVGVVGLVGLAAVE